MAVTKFQVATIDNGKSTTLNFGNKVQSATAAVQGFKMSYGSDHHVLKITVAAGLSTIDGSNVTVTGTSEMADSSGNVGTGSVTALVIATVDAG